MSRQKTDPKRQASIGQAELEVLSYIQEHHPVPVREVADHLAQTRGVVRTTVLNVMTRLCHKGFLSRRRVTAAAGAGGKGGREGVYEYWPRIPRGQVLRNLVKDFVDDALGGSTAPFVAYLCDNVNVTDEELAKLRKLVSDLEGRGNKGDS